MLAAVKKYLCAVNASIYRSSRFTARDVTKGVSRKECHERRTLRPVRETEVLVRDELIFNQTHHQYQEGFAKHDT